MNQNCGIGEGGSLGLRCYRWAVGAYPWPDAVGSSRGPSRLRSQAVGTGLSGFLTRDTKKAQRASRPPCTLQLASAL